MAINVQNVVNAEKQRKLLEQRAVAKNAQVGRQRRRTATIHSLRVAFNRTPIPDFMCDHIASYIRISFVLPKVVLPKVELPKVELPKVVLPKAVIVKSAMHVIAGHRDLDVVTRHCSDNRASWPLMDQFLVTETFDWENQELSTYLKDIYPNPEQRLERNIPPGFREYLETIKLKELKALCRQTPGARSAGKKSDLVRELLIFTQF